MRRQRALKPESASSQQPHRHRHLAHQARQLEPGAYTIAQVISRVPMSRRTFYRLLALGELTFLEELPRLGGLRRFRADLVEEWVANDFNRKAS